MGRSSIGSRDSFQLTISSVNCSSDSGTPSSGRRILPMRSGSSATSSKGSPGPTRRQKRCTGQEFRATKRRMTPARSRPRRRHSRTGTKIRSGRRRRVSGGSGWRVARGGRVRIGIISDTHGLIRPEALAALRGVDAILHAGDIGGEHVLEALRAIAPVTFVRGNSDGADGYDIVRVSIGGIRFLLTHILPRGPRSAVRASLAALPADIVIFGHSHLPHNE